MSSRRVEFPFAYRLTFVPRRGRSEKSLILKDSVFVDVPELSSKDAPVAFDLREEGSIPQPRYDVEGVLYRDAHGLFNPEVATLARTKELLYDDRTRPWPNYMNQDRRVDRPSMMDRLILDEYDTVRNDVIDKAKGIRFRDGGFIYPEEAPALKFWALPGVALFIGDIDFHPSEGGYRFPMNRFDESMREFSTALREHDFGLSQHLRGHKILGDASRMAIDCRAHNAAFASQHVRHHLGQRFVSATPDHILKVADLVELGDRVLDDVSLLPDLKRVLAEMAELFPTPKSPVRRHAAIGLAAIEMAERFHSEDMLVKPAPRIGR